MVDGSGSTWRRYFASYSVQRILLSPLCFLSLTSYRQSDLEIRRLLNTTNPLSATNDAPSWQGWPTLGLDCKLITSYSFRTAKAAPANLRMNSFGCIRPAVDGYSAAINGLYIAKSYTHRPGARPNSDGNMDGVCGWMLWIHMPDSQDEHLKETWAIRDNGSTFIVLIVRHRESHGKARLFKANDVPIARS